MGRGSEKFFVGIFFFLKRIQCDRRESQIMAEQLVLLYVVAVCQSFRESFVNKRANFRNDVRDQRRDLKSFQAK